MALRANLLGRFAHSGAEAQRHGVRDARGCSRAVPPALLPAVSDDHSLNSDELRRKFGKRIQRCYGCYIAFFMKDLWLGEDATFFCENCKSDDMFHFDDFSTMLDLEAFAKLREGDDDHHGH